MQILRETKPVRYLYLVRHGRANYKSGVFGGSLTAGGRRQARAAARFVSQWPISVIHTSDLGRAVESAEIISDHCGGARIRKTRLLREMIATGWKGHRVPLAHRRHEVLVSHGNTIRTLACLVLKIRLTAAREMDTSNTGITRFAIGPKGRVVLLSYNETAHLPPDLVTFV